MGYTTNFIGQFKLNKQLSLDDYNFLRKLNEEGEFYVDGGGMGGQDHEDNIINYNTPPKTQPGLGCQWRPTEDGKFIEWDGGEKFYDYTEWLQYLIDKVLKPRGYSLDGSVNWQGEDFDDRGTITVKNNIVTTKVIGAPEGAVECPNCGEKFVP